MLRGQPVIHTQHHRIGAVGNVAAQAVVLVHAANGKAATVHEQDCRRHPWRQGRTITPHPHRAAIVPRHLVIDHHRQRHRRHIQQIDDIPVQAAGLFHGTAIQRRLGGAERQQEAQAGIQMGATVGFQAGGQLVQHRSGQAHQGAHRATLEYCRIHRLSSLYLPSMTLMHQAVGMKRY